MSYSEKDGQVILTLSREDYGEVLARIRGARDNASGEVRNHLSDLYWRLNAGNPNYTPYRAEEK